MPPAPPPSDRPTVRLLHPEPPTTVTIADAYRHPAAAIGDRSPWVALCMIASLDGGIAVDGTSGALGNATDRDVLLTLRDHSDVVVVGAGTARGEGYGAPRSGVRVGVVTNTGVIDPEAELFRSGAGFVIAPERVAVEGEATGAVEVVRAGRSRVDLALALARLDRVVPDVRRVQVEGGPTLNGSLLEADLIDELNLTISPVIVGGVSSRVTSQASEQLRRFDLAQLLVDSDGYTFGRWVRRPT